MSKMLYSVIKDKLPSAFSGRIHIGDSKGPLNAQFSITDTFVTIIPLSKDAGQSIHKCCYNVGKEAEHHRWFYGISDNNSAVAFLQSMPMQERMSTGVDMGAVYFNTPLIVHGSSPSNRDVSKYDAIEFYGGVMNVLYNPSYAIDYGDNNICFKDASDYTHTYESIINGEKIKVILFIRASFDVSLDVPDLKNNLSSVLRFEFEDNKTLDDIVKYYNYALRLFQFWTGRLNVRSDICLFNSDNSDSPIYVRLVDGYSDYANDSLKALYQKGILSLGYGLPKLLSILNDDNKKPYLEFLPAANKYVKEITYTQVIDLCVSFEIEHKRLLEKITEHNDKSSEDKVDSDIKKEASDFAKVLIEYIDKSNANQQIKDKAKGIISGNLSNFSPSQKEKMFFIFDRYKNEMRLITEQKANVPVSDDNPLAKKLNKLEHETLGIVKFYSDNEFKEKIRKFVAVRGSTAHAGIKWNGGEEIYLHLVLLVYFSILERADYNDPDRRRILSWLFSYRF